MDLRIAFIGARLWQCIRIVLAHVICLVLWSRITIRYLLLAFRFFACRCSRDKACWFMSFTLATGLGDHITAAVNAGAGHGGA